MTTIYRNKRNPNIRRVIGIVAFTLLLIGAGALMRTSLMGGIDSIFAGLWQQSDATGSFMSRVPAYFAGIAALEEENARLREEAAVSKRAVLDRNLLFEENLMLKESMGRSAQPNALLAAVLVRPPELPYDTLIIDVGTDAAVRVGDVVAAHGSLRIGSVASVESGTARVTLYSTPGATYEGFLRGSVPITVEGIGAGSLRATVPYDAHAAVGDLVTLPGIEPNFAFVVEQVEAGRGDSAAEVYLRLSVNPFSLKYVEVWRAAYAQ